MNITEYFQHKGIEYIKNGVLRKFPLLGTTMSKLKFIEDNEHTKTAKTDGESVYYNTNFMKNLKYDQKVFLFAHELMHVAFNHIHRMKDKDHDLWNKATDAVINQLLMGENLQKIENCIDIKEAIDKSAEEMYNIMLSKREEYDEMFADMFNNGKENDIKENNGDPTKDQHDIWDKVLERENSTSSQYNDSEKQKPSTNDNESKNKGPEDDNAPSGNQPSPIDDAMVKRGDGGILEDTFRKENEELRKSIGEKVRKKLKDERIQAENLENRSKISGGYKSSFDGVGTSKPVVSWKKILKNEFEKEEDRYSYRRANEDNYWSARMESMEVEDKPEIEVMLDVSGSVSDTFLKAFLRQLKPLFKNSVLRVGCFDEYVYPKKLIKSLDDIDKFEIERQAIWTENWDGAVRSFSKKIGVNKIVFTDGCPCPGVMPKADLKKTMVYWLVYDNRNFKPCCGKVIFIDPKELNKMNIITDEFNM